MFLRDQETVFQNKNKWAILYQPLPGNYSYYFPCNTNEDSLQAITRGANQNDVFQVRFSGGVKSTCPNENFGIVSGVTTFDYIILDSLKRDYMKNIFIAIIVLVFNVSGFPQIIELNTNTS